MNLKTERNICGELLSQEDSACGKIRKKEVGEEGLLLDMIHKSNDPAHATETAIKVILGFLERPQSFGEPCSDSQKGQVEIAQ